MFAVFLQCHFSTGPKGIVEQLERDCSAVIDTVKESTRSVFSELIYGKILEKYLKKVAANQKVFIETYTSVCKVGVVRC